LTWAIADHMRVDLVEYALKAAPATWGSLRGAIFHSDHGSVYTSKFYATPCGRLGVTQPMGAVGSSADNALAESFNAALKREVLQDAARWSDEPTCRRQVFKWLTRYNTKRRHSWCRYQSPSTYETRWAAKLPTSALSHPVSTPRGQGPIFAQQPITASASSHSTQCVDWSDSPRSWIIVVPRIASLRRV
jgi:transposase InsO family protein